MASLIPKSKLLSRSTRIVNTYLKIVESSMQTKQDISSSLFDMDEKSLAIPLDDESVAAEESKKRFYGFKLGKLNLLLDSQVHSEVVEKAEIMPIPLMPQYVLGLCNVRGNLVPVYDLYNKFEIEVESQNSGRVLILGENENMVGIQIEEMLVSLAFEEFDCLEDIPSSHSQINEHVTECYKKDGKYWFGFNYITLFESL